MDSPAKHIFVIVKFNFSGIAQLVEQATVNRWVAGSSPAAGATLKAVLLVIY